MAKIAMILGEMFEDAEFREPYDALRRAGHEVVIIGSEAKQHVTGKKEKERVATEESVRDVRPDEFDALVIPGGYSPDHLRTDPHMVEFVREIVHSGTPVAAICHAPWMLAEADVIDGRTVTSWPSIKTDLVNAGANWVDREVFEDGNLITSRKPADLPAFIEAILRHLEGNIPARSEAWKSPSRPSPSPPAI